MEPMTAQELTETVVSRFDTTPDVRLHRVMVALVRHLHAFVTEVGLSEDEWFAGIRFLTETGQISSDTRQEFILLSDTLGVSMLVDLINNRKSLGATESTIFGPFYVPDAPVRANGESIDLNNEGEPLLVRGAVRSTDGTPLAGALVDVWQTAPNGFYDVQDPTQPRFNFRGRFFTDRSGRYEFRTARPVPYPIPDDGPVGRMLSATGRHPWRAGHIHALVSADGHARLITQHLRFGQRLPRLGRSVWGQVVVDTFISTSRGPRGLAAAP